MSETWNHEEVAIHILRFMPRFGRLISAHVTTLSGNDATMMQISALHMMSQHPMTTSDLAKKRHVSLQAASTFVQGMVDRGWVVRVVDPNDRRRSILEVTEEGHKQEEKIHTQMTQYVTGLVAELNPDETIAAKTFLEGLDRILLQHPLDDESCKENDKLHSEA